MKRSIWVLVILSMVLTGCSSSSSVSTVRIGPAPLPFDHPIEVIAQSYPVHPNQTFTLYSQGKDWKGKTVRIYYLPTTESNNEELMYKKVLPTWAQYIGSSDIQDGTWHFDWKAPQRLTSERSGYDSFLMAAQAEDGCLSGTEVMTLLYDKLQLAPSKVKVGQEVELSGSGFPAGDVRIDILKNEDNSGTLFQTTIGTLHATNGTFDFSFNLPSSVNGYKIEPGLYQVQAVIIPPNQAREGIFVNLNVQ